MSSNSIWTTGGIVNQGFSDTGTPKSGCKTTTITKKELALTLQQLQLQHSNFNNNLNELCKSSSTNNQNQNHQRSPSPPHFNFHSNSPNQRKVSQTISGMFMFWFIQLSSYSFFGLFFEESSVCYCCHSNYI